MCTELATGVLRTRTAPGQIFSLQDCDAPKKNSLNSCVAVRNPKGPSVLQERKRKPNLDESGPCESSTLLNDSGESLGNLRQARSEEFGKTQQRGRRTMCPLWDGKSVAPRDNDTPCVYIPRSRKEEKEVPAQRRKSATHETGVNYADYIT